jgi:NO-binding membrane sensor protein with MHYT domain
MNPFHRPGIVVLSIVVAILASFATFDLAGQVAAEYGQSRTTWLGGGAVVLGTGVWAMHFVAMLAFYLLAPTPCIRVETR